MARRVSGRPRAGGSGKRGSGSSSLVPRLLVALLFAGCATIFPGIAGPAAVEAAEASCKAGGREPPGGPPPAFPALACKVEVSDAAALEDALRRPRCGCEIVLADGDYPGGHEIEAACEREEPLVVRSRSLGGATLGSVEVKGRNITLAGVRLTGGALVRGHSNLLTASILDGDGMRVRGSRNRISYNEITNARRGVEVALGGKGSANAGNVIDHNYFHDHRHQEQNSHAPIRVLNDPFSDSGTVIEYNLLEKVGRGGEGEVISIKTSGSTIRYNTVRNSIGTITNRSGSNNSYVGNYIENSRGLRVFGDRNLIEGNRLIDANILLHAGTGTMDSRGEGCGNKRATNPDCTGAFSAARRARVVGNTVTDGKIVVGEAFERFRFPQDVPVERAVLSRNDAEVELVPDRQVDTVVERGSPATKAEVRMLTPSDVGPRAVAAWGYPPAPSCDSGGRAGAGSGGTKRRG